jgi:hypothetical protein
MHPPSQLENIDPHSSVSIRQISHTLLFFKAVKRKSGSFHCATDTRRAGEEAAPFHYPFKIGF